MASSFDSASQKLLNGDPPFPLDDLPTRREEPLWEKLETHYGLSLAESSLLKNHACRQEQRQKEQRQQQQRQQLSLHYELVSQLEQQIHEQRQQLEQQLHEQRQQQQEQQLHEQRQQLEQQRQQQEEERQLREEQRQLREEQRQLHHSLHHTLKLLAEEINKTRKSRLNCWERESARTTRSKCDADFRKKVIRYYKRESSSRKSVKCQILDVYVTHAEAQDTIVATHIWKASTRGKYLEEFDLRAEDVNNARNGMFLTKGIEEAFDNQQLCFLYNTLKGELCLWVADASILSTMIEGSNPPKNFADVHQKPLRCRSDHVPFRRLLSWHARLTLELRKQDLQVSNYVSEYDLAPGIDSGTRDPISRAIDEMVEPGEDASVSG